MSIPFSFHSDIFVATCPADSLFLAEADAICEKWDPERMVKRHEKAENTLWNNRVYTAPMLLDDLEVYQGTGGHVVSVEIGELGIGWWGDLRDDRFVVPLLTLADLD